MRLHLLSSGRRSRQRKRAAELIDDVSYRIRTQFPHPIAYRWRTVEAAQGTLEGYMQILECAETAACYLAIIAILMAQNVENAKIKTLDQIAKRLSKLNSHGMAMGDWIGILREVKTAKMFKQVSENVPFYEILEFLKDANTDAALQKLSDERNDQAHGRGPKTDSEVEKKFEECFKYLETFLTGAEFISEYPLRYIEYAQWDSFKRVNRYDYRDLMGDHPLVPQQKDQVQNDKLEASSLYLVDRAGELHLLRPFLTRKECPECHRKSIFFLDKYDKHKDSCELKALEDGHTFKDEDLADVFRHVGLLNHHSG